MTPNIDAIRLLAVDDHALLRGGIAALISTQADMALIGEAMNGRDGVQQYRALKPDVVLMDIQMPGMDGIQALIAIRSEFPDAHVIVLTTYDGDVQAVRALKAGAQAYLLKSLLEKDLLTTIRDVHAGRKRIEPAVAARLADHMTDDALSVREIEVLRLIGDGNSNRIIASKLDISEDTVKGHVKNILSKLGANDRTHAVTIGLKRGIIAL